MTTGLLLPDDALHRNQTLKEKEEKKKRLFKYFEILKIANHSEKKNLALSSRSCASAVSEHAVSERR